MGFMNIFKKFLLSLVIFFYILLEESKIMSKREKKSHAEANQDAKQWTKENEYKPSVNAN